MEIPEEYHTLDLYAVLVAKRSHNQAEIRKSYLRRALRTHPDKGGDAEEFHKVSFAYSILSNEKHRSQYDEIGKLDFRQDAEIADLFSQMVRVEITEGLIEEDRAIYQHSEEERLDVFAAYKKFRGDFDRIFECIIHSTVDDIPRLVDIIAEAVDDGALPKYTAFNKTTSAKNLKRRRTVADSEAKEVESSRKQQGIETRAGLAALIQKRQQQRSSYGGIISQLEQKYMKPAKNGKAK